ncbi:MAG TPA: ribosome recycling factor [Patescibacteria group bacterium]|nr:ribosome recycling factor [Patescibacteria group bacterium]
MSIIDNHQNEFGGAIEHFKQDISSLKTGRANPAVLDGIAVSAYGVQTPLNQVASISVVEARSIVIQPWDKNIINDIDKAISQSGLDLGAINEGDKIRITVPQMTEESRKEIVKLLHHKMEEARVAIRNIRDKIKEEILEAEKNKEFGEDEKYSQIEELDKKTGDHNDQIKEVGDKKEQEIMTV